MTITSDWVITFTFDVDPSMETMDEWESRLESFNASVARIPGRGVVDVTVYAHGDLTMVDAINKTINEVAHVVQSGAPVGLEVVTELEHARRAEAPTMPELMSAAEIADELGVRRQRVHQLRQNPAFPAPLAELRGGAVWDAAAVRKFKEEWERRAGRPRSGLQSLGRQEREACLIAERALGAVAEAWDGGGRQGAVDAMLTLRDGRKAAFEVTNLAAKDALHTASLLARENHRWPLPGKWFWRIDVGSVEDLRRLKATYEKIILLCEAAGEPDPRRIGWDPSADPDLQWLVRSKSTLWGHPELLAKDMPNPGATVVSASGGGVIDHSMSGFAAELGKAFKSPHISRHFRKLAEVDADERHLFIALHDSALPFSVAAELMFEEESLPPEPPPVPDYVTHVWLAPAFSRRVLLWSRGKGWESFSPYEHAK
nr:hypothetical protein [Mycobacterium sp.]